MSPGAWAAKSALTWLAVLVLVAAGFAAHYALIQGYVTPQNKVSPGVCRAIATGLNGPGALVLDPAHKVMFIAASGRAAGPGGIYLLKLDDLAAAPQKLAGAPANTNPQGLDLYRASDGGETLMVIDRNPNGRSMIQTYDISFDGGTAKLTQQLAMQSGALVSPNAIAALAPDHFFVTNDHAATGALGRFAEDYLLWPHADVVLSNGLGFRIAVQRIASPTGLLAKGAFLYVAASNERRLIAFHIEDFTGNLTEIGSLSLPARLGNISLDAGGNLIVAGQTRPGSSQVFRVKLGADAIPQSYETIFSDDGQVLKGSSAAAVWNNQLFIGASDDSKILACGIK